MGAGSTASRGTMSLSGRSGLANETFPTTASAANAGTGAARRGVPVFGICFGNQVLAHALGGTVERAREPEIGWMDVVSDIPLTIAEGPWMQWHYDVVTVPGQATELARSGLGPQAWRLGRMFSTQFHPEANEAMLRRWTTGFGADELVRIGSSAEELMATTQASVKDSRENSDRIVDWFCETIVPSEFHDVLNKH